MFSCLVEHFASFHLHTQAMESAGDADLKYNYLFDDFVAGHKAQLMSADIPEQLWLPLFTKLASEVFDAGDFMSLVFEEDVENGHPWKVLSSQKIDHNSDVFIVDHAWSFKMSDQKKILMSNDALLKRIGDMVGVPTDGEESSDEEEIQGEETDKERIGRERRESRNEEKRGDAVKEIIRRLWKYIGTYSIRFQKEDGEESSTVWYVMDELGSRIGHSRTPNARLVPLFFAPHGLAYSVLIFNQSLEGEVEILRDCTESLVSLQHPDWADILEIAWKERDFSHLPVHRPFPSEAFFTGGRSSDELADAVAQSKCKFLPHSPLRIYADDTQLVEHLSIPFELVSELKYADIVWLHRHFYNYRELAELNPGAVVNQFPCECCLTTKDLLSAILCMGDKPAPFYQITFNLNTELPQFASHYQRIQKSGEDNTWIVKPWNLARGLDMTVSDSLEHIVRLVETGPKIACKYIDRPVLFHREDTDKMVKFDLRFIVFVNSVRPLEAYVYNNFWIRFAINEFSLDELDDCETHFTVFNYSDEGKILQMKCGDFIEGLQKSNPTISWKDTREAINGALRGVLEAASREEAPRGIASNAQSRAMYGVDVMLQWDDAACSSCSPSVLEVNFMPDCSRACTYYPDFADTVFHTLFLGKIEEDKVTRL